MDNNLASGESDPLADVALAWKSLWEAKAVLQRIENKFYHQTWSCAKSQAARRKLWHEKSFDGERKRDETPLNEKESHEIPPGCSKGNGAALCPAWPQTCSLKSPSVSSGPSRMTSLSPRGDSRSAPCSPARREAAGEGTAGRWSPAKSLHSPRRDDFREQADSRGHPVQKEKSPCSLHHPPHRPFSAVPHGSQSNVPVPTALLLPTYHLSSTNKPSHHKLEELWKRSPQNKLEQLKKRIQEQKQKQRASTQEQQHLTSAWAKEPLQKRPLKRKVCRVVSAPPAPAHRDQRERSSAQRIQTQSQKQPSPKSSVLEKAATGKGAKLPGASAWREGQKLARKLLGPPPTFPNLRSMAEEQTTANAFEPGKGFAALTRMENSSREKENEPVGKSPALKSCMVPPSKPVERGRNALAKGIKQILRNLHLQSQYHDEHRHTRLSKDTAKGKVEVLHQNLGIQSPSPGPWVITPSAFAGGKIPSSVMKDGAKSSSSGNCSRGKNASPQRQKGSSSPALKEPEKENLKHPSKRKVNVRKPHPYSPEIVQEFMHRKNEERKKKSLEEKKSLVRAMEMRNKRLQEVYRKQKEAVGKKTCSEQMCKLLRETAPIKESPQCKLEQEQTGAGTLGRSFMAWPDKTSCSLLSKDHRGRNRLLETLQSPEKREPLPSPASLESNCWFLSPLRCEDLRDCSPPPPQAPFLSFFLPQKDAKPYFKDSSSGLSPYRSKQDRVKAIQSLSEELAEKTDMATKRLKAASWVKGFADKTSTEAALDLYNESSSVPEPETSKDEQDRTMTIQMLLHDPDPDEFPVSSDKDFHGLESSLVGGTEGETTLDRQKEIPTALPGGTAANKEFLWIIRSSGQRHLNPGGDPSNILQGFPVNKGFEGDVNPLHEKPATSPASPSQRFFARSLQRELTAQRNRCWCGTILKAQNQEEIATQTPRASLRTPDSLRSQLSGAETHYDGFEQDFGEGNSHYTALEEKHSHHLNNLRQTSLLLAHKLKVHQLQQKEQLMVLREKAKLELQESQRFLSDLLQHSSEECSCPSMPGLVHVEQTWSGCQLEGDNTTGSNQEMHSLTQSALKLEGDRSPVDPKIAGEGEALGRRGSYCSVLRGPLSAEHDQQTPDQLMPPVNHPHGEACVGADSGASSEGTSSSSHSQWSEVGQHYGSSSTFSSFSLAMVEQCLRGEELRARHQDALLKLREKALQEKARAELAWLGHQKSCLENLQDSKGASAMAAKQRKILMELKQEQAEIQHLQNIYRAAHQERKLLLKQQREILKIQHSTAQLQEKMHNLTGKQELLSQSLDVSLTSSAATEAGTKLETMRLISSPRLYSSSAESTAHPERPDLSGNREAHVQLKNKQSKKYEGDKPAHRRTVNIGVGLEQTGPGGTLDVPKLWLCIDLSCGRVQRGNSALYPPCSFCIENKKILGRYQKLAEETPCLEQSLGVRGPDASEMVAKKVCCDTGQTTGSVFTIKDCKNTELNAQDHGSLSLEHTPSARMEEPICTTMAREGRKCSFLESVKEEKTLHTNLKTDPKDNEDVNPCDSKFTAKGLGVLSTLCNLCLVQAENTLQGTVNIYVPVKEVEKPVPYEIHRVDGSHCFKHLDHIYHEASDEQLNLRAFSEGLTPTESLSKSNNLSLRSESAKSDSSPPEFQKVSAVWIDISESSVSDLEFKLKNGEDTDVSIPEESDYDNGDVFPDVSKETLKAISNGREMLPSAQHYEHEVPKDDSTETSPHLQKYPGDVSDHGSTDLLSFIPSEKANASKPKSADSSQSDNPAKGMDEPHSDTSENYSRNKTCSRDITKHDKDAVASSSCNDIYSPKISEQHKLDSTTSGVKKDVGVNSLFVDHNRDLTGFPPTGSLKCLDSVTDQLRNAVSFPPDQNITSNKLLPCLSSINFSVSGDKSSHAQLSNEKLASSKLSTMSTYMAGISEEVHKETPSSESLQRAATGNQGNSTTERQAIKEARKGLFSSVSSKNQLFQAESCSSKCEDDTIFVSDEGPPPTDEDTLSEILSPVDEVLSYGSADLPSSSKKDLSFPSEDLPPPPLGADATKNDDSTFSMDDFPSPPEQMTVSETMQCMDEDISLKMDALPPLPDNTVPEEFPLLNQEATGAFSHQDCSLSEQSLVKEISSVKEGLLEHQQEERETPLQGLELLPVSNPIPSGQVGESPDFMRKQCQTYLALPKAEEDSEDPLLAFEIGDRVLVKQTQPGTLKFKGRTCFDSGHWAGVALDKAEGDNAGTYKGVKYFECAQHCGIFVRPDEISHLLGANENGSSSTGDEDSDSEDDEFFKRDCKYSKDKQGGGLTEQKAEDTNSAGGSEVKENQCRLQSGKEQKLLCSDQTKCNEFLSKNNLTCLGSDKEKPQLTQMKQRILADMFPVKSETGNTDKVNTNKTICCLVEDHERNKLPGDIASELCRKLLLDTLITFSQTAQYRYKSAFEKDMLNYGKGLRREGNQKQFLLKENSVAILSEQSAKVSDVLLCDFDMFSIRGCHTVEKRIVTKFVADAVKEYKKIKRKHGSEADKIFLLSSETSPPATLPLLIKILDAGVFGSSEDFDQPDSDQHMLVRQTPKQYLYKFDQWHSAPWKRTAEIPLVIPHYTSYVKELSAHAVEELWTPENIGSNFRRIGVPKNFESNDLQGNDLEMESKRMYNQIIFDLARELLHAEYQVPANPNTLPWMKENLGSLCSRAHCRSDVDDVKMFVQDEIIKIMNLEKNDLEMKRKILKMTRYGNCKRDRVDLILIQELHKEEPQWTYYADDELTVKMRVTEDIFDTLIFDTIRVLNQIYLRKACD